MLRNLIIFSLCYISIQASGELLIIGNSDGIEFKGNEPLNGEAATEAMLTAMGDYCDDGQKWSGLSINDPFLVPQHGCMFIITGVKTLNYGPKIKSYSMSGSPAGELMKGPYSKNDFSMNIVPYIFNFILRNEALAAFEETFGKPPPKPTFKSTNNLKPNLHQADKDFLTNIFYCNEIISSYAASPDSDRPEMVIFIIPLDAIAKAHGVKSAAMEEAVEMVKSSINEMNKVMKETSKHGHLIVAIADNSDSNRSKREAVDPNDNKKLNLATYYNDDYPVIFNIILWFMVVFGFSLLAICYAIGSMDPGRDSIIYRMTSTRMKKDN